VERFFFALSLMVMRGVTEGEMLMHVIVVKSL
jgi:hypothetical protein